MNSDTEALLPVFIEEMQAHLERLDELLLRAEKSEQERQQPALLQEIFRILHTLKGGYTLFGFRQLSGVIHEAENLANQLRTQTRPFSDAEIDAFLQLSQWLQKQFDSLQNETPAEVPASLREALSAPPQPAAPRDPVQPPQARPTEKPQALTAEAPRSESSLQVPVSLLNRLMDRSAELMALRHSFFEITALLPQHMQHRFQQACLRYQLLAQEVHDSLLHVRMQPVEQLWRHYPRMLRDLAQKTGKQVHLETEGSQTEVDKAVLEHLRDPLIHLLRNALDHGIELPAERSRQGKPPQGRIRLKAWYEQGMMLIMLEDDGQGLNQQKILARARDQGLLPETEAQEPDQRSLFQLIFQPGFSTAASVSDISGRGVGLDIVKTHLDQINGQIEVYSSPGQGSRFVLRVPLTLSLISALLIREHGQICLIPQHHILDILALPEAPLQRLGDRHYCRWRGQNLPMLSLEPLFGMPPEAPAFVLILQGQSPFALQVTELEAIQDITLKPLSSHWQEQGLLSGASLLGSGELALVLSVMGLEQALPHADMIIPQRQAVPALAPAASVPVPEILLFKGINGQQMGLEAAELFRLEALQSEAVQWMGERAFVAWQGQLLPLVEPSRYLQQGDILWPADSLSENDYTLLVCQHQGRFMGLMAREILDFLPLSSLLKGPPIHPGSLASLSHLGSISAWLNLSLLWQRLQADSTPPELSE